MTVRTLRPPKFRWTLAVACNYYRNGMFQGWCDSVQLGCGRGDFNYGTDFLDDHELTLTGSSVRFRTSEKHPGRAKLGGVGGVVFEFRGYKEWVGNWCWDAMFVERQTVREIVRMLKAKGWVCESSGGLLIDWFDRITA